MAKGARLRAETSNVNEGNDDAKCNYTHTYCSAITVHSRLLQTRPSGGLKEELLVKLSETTAEFAGFQKPNKA